MQDTSRTPLEPAIDPDEAARQDRRRRGKVRRTLVLAAGLAALWLVLVSDAGLFRMALAGVGLIAGGALIVAIALVPSYLGHALFAGIDRLLASCRRAGRWPEDERPDDLRS